MRIQTDGIAVPPKDVTMAVIGAIGTRPDPDIPPVSYIEVATAPMVFAQLDAGVVDAVIADGDNILVVADALAENDRIRSAVLWPGEGAPTSDAGDESAGR